MVEGWLSDAMANYNRESYEKRQAYAGQLHLPGHLFQDLIWWALQALPDEILVGLEIDSNKANLDEVEQMFAGEDQRSNLFAGQGYLVSEAKLVNRGDSFSVHHLPEEWTDGMFANQRGSRGGRFTHWLHTHPNAPAIPSEADADAAQETIGVDLILGLRFSPEGFLPWFDDVEGQTRSLTNNEEEQTKQPRKRSWFARNKLPVLGIAPSGHRIHDIQLIAFHKTGLGINVVLVDEDGLPFGWPELNGKQ